jgi:hypothetical protein
MEPAGDRRRRALLLMLVAVTLALGWILQPFWGAILWACDHRPDLPPDVPPDAAARGRAAQPGAPAWCWAW